MPASVPKDIPPADAPDSDFTFVDPLEREAACAWAQVMLADCQHYADEQLIRASRVLLHNSPEDFKMATEFLAVLNAKPEQVMA